MNPGYLLHRAPYLKRAIFKLNNKNMQKVCWASNNSSSSSSSDDEKKDKKAAVSEQKRKSEEALNKLNLLLKSMIEESTTETPKSKLDLAKPTDKRKKHKENEDEEVVKVESTEKEMVKAVKKVAKAVGGDIKQTESELLMKLLSTNETNITTENLSEIMKGMKVVQDEDTQQSRAQQVRQILQQVQHSKGTDPKQSKSRFQQRFPKETPKEKIDLFGSEPLGIFTDLPKDATEGMQNKTWNQLYQRDLKLAVTHPPSNYFQQMILWTEQGKVWKFPIDNEQGLTEEKKIYFAEHVFLEKHLEPWCPSKGPLRHFMELVCVGLSKNPYLTVDMKKEHIEWFKNYFEEKKQLLQEVGALQGSDMSSANSPKQIE